MKLVGTLAAEKGMRGTLAEVGTLSGSLTLGGTPTYERYDGEYEVEPTTEEQVLSTAYKIATANVVVKPIPQNYGRIDWNGSFLTVS